MSKRNQAFRFFRVTHKWVGGGIGLILAMMAVTGLLLLKKKHYAWLQPPTLEGAPGQVEEFITYQRLFQVVFDHGHPDFRVLGDIDRIDTRPGDRVHKVRSIHNNMEIQVDMVTGSVLSVETRRSDLIEQIHDGSFFADVVHNWVMPTVALAMLVLVTAGYYLWLTPYWRRHVIRRHRREREAALKQR